MNFLIIKIKVHSKYLVTFVIRSTTVHPSNLDNPQNKDILKFTPPPLLLKGSLLKTRKLSLRTEDSFQYIILAAAPLAFSLQRCKKWGRKVV